MKEIKFRAWSKKDKAMIPWNVTELNYFLKFPEKYELMQYIGLKDKNGKEIYEGDICKCPINPKSADYLQLEAGDKCFVIRTISIPEVYQEGLPEDCEVIGNIYENPELALSK